MEQMKSIPKEELLELIKQANAGLKIKLEQAMNKWKQERLERVTSQYRVNPRPSAFAKFVHHCNLSKTQFVGSEAEKVLCIQEKLEQDVQQQLEFGLQASRRAQNWQSNGSGDFYNFIQDEAKIKHWFGLCSNLSQMTTFEVGYDTLQLLFKYAAVYGESIEIPPPSSVGGIPPRPSLHSAPEDVELAVSVPSEPSKEAARVTLPSDIPKPPECRALRF